MTEYKCIVADPPWNETGGGKCKRGADRHYSLLKTSQIFDVMRQFLNVLHPADDCIMWLWYTDNYLIDAITVAEQLDFRYVRTLIWCKSGRFGLGQYLRGAHEGCLLCVRGHALKLIKNKSTPSVIHAPKTRHSEKPEAFFSTARQLCEGPYLELFARTRRPGWDQVIEGELIRDV